MVGFLKDTGPTDGQGEWRLADPAHEGFATIVPDAVLAVEDLIVVRGACGLVKVDEVWTHMEKPKDTELAAWKERKSVGANIDPRILPLVRDRAGTRVITEAAAIEGWKETAEDDFPLRGPKLAKEFMLALTSSGQTTVTHHLEFKAACGLPDRGAIAREHHALCEIVRLLTVHDMVDCSMLAGAELLIRRLHSLETAVSRNAKIPDWEGLDHVVSANLTHTGAATAPKFAKWLAATQAEEASIMKNTRLLREERAGGGKGGGRGRKGKEDPLDGA